MAIDHALSFFEKLNMLEIYEKVVQVKGEMIMGSQLFVKSGTWTKPSGVSMVNVLVVGAGGGCSDSRLITPSIPGPLGCTQCVPGHSASGPFRVFDPGSATQHCRQIFV